MKKIFLVGSISLFIFSCGVELDPRDAGLETCKCFEDFANEGKKASKLMECTKQLQTYNEMFKAADEFNNDSDSTFSKTYAETWSTCVTVDIIKSFF